MARSKEADTGATEAAAAAAVPEGADAAGAGTQDAAPAPEIAAEAGPAEGVIAVEVTEDDTTEGEGGAPSHHATHRPDYAPHGGSGGGFLAGLLGGALAIAAGVGALWLSNPDLLRGKAPEPDLSPLEARIDTQAAEIARIGEAVGHLGGAPAAGGEDLAALRTENAARLDRLESSVSALSAGLDGLRRRAETLEARPAASAGADSAAAIRDELDRQRATLEALLREAQESVRAANDQAATMRAEAETTARTATLQAALGRLDAALESGGPFAEALAALSQAGATEIPAALSGAAERGVATMAALQAEFPDAARAALAASIREGLPADAGAMDRVGAFLRAQTGARSTTAREGDDADAVLSRAEAALAAGDLEAAIATLDALPAAGQQAMAGWRDTAEARLSAVQAAAALAAALPAN